LHGTLKQLETTERALFFESRFKLMTQ